MFRPRSIRVAIAWLLALLCLLHARAAHAQAPDSIANRRMILNFYSGTMGGLADIRHTATNTYSALLNGVPDQDGTYSYGKTSDFVGIVNYLTANNQTGLLRPDSITLTFSMGSIGILSGRWTNADSSEYGVYFLTAPPSVFTSAATNVTTGAATLNANLNPNGEATVAQFQYGTTTNYGSAAAIPLPPNFGADGTNGSEGFSVAITGLAAGTLYHFRAMATNVVGGTVGDDQTFTTLSATPLIITQPQSQVVIATSNVAFTVAASGSGLTYQWRKGVTDIPSATSATLTLNNVTRAASGTYSVVVTSGGSSTPSGGATLRVIVPQQLLAPQRAVGGQFQLLFTDPDNSAASDLSRFEVHHTTNFLGASTVWVTNSGSFTISNGKILFDDAGSLGTARRYYRVIEK